MTTKEILEAIKNWSKEDLHNLNNHIQWILSDKEDEED